MNEKDSDTKTRLLDAAERLFAERGFAAASLRAITAAAQVNLAAVNYHFRSKEALLHAVFSRRLGPLNRQRLRILEEAEARAGRRSLPLEDILEAFVAPTLRLRAELAHSGASFQRLMGRLIFEPAEIVQTIFKDQFAGLAVRFQAALVKALPKLPPVDMLWRIHFTIGAMAFTMAGTHILTVLARNRCDPADVEGTIRRLVAYLAAGLRAPHGASRRRRRAT
jgi:AcrR family transcriptional regulator